MFGRNAVENAKKALDDLTTRAAKIAARLARARVDLAELDATALDVDDDQVLVKAGKRRREAADVIATLAAQLEAAQRSQAAAEENLSAARREVDAASVERLRAEAAELDAQIRARLDEAFAAAVPDAAKLRAVVATANRAREALEPAARGRPVRANFAEAADAAGVARIAADLAQQGVLR